MTVYILTASSNDLDTTNVETLGDYYSMVFGGLDEATEAARWEAQEGAREHDGMDDVVVAVKTIEIEEPAGLPEGMSASLRVSDGVVVVSLTGDADAAAWQEAEEAIDFAGLAFHAAGPQDPGTYQQWVRA